MTDVVVTVPKGIWQDWLEEGDAAGEPETGEEWGFFTWGTMPSIEPGERVYIVAHGRLRGWAPLTALRWEPVRGGMGRIGFGRKGGALAVTIPEEIRGFRGWRVRWWDRSAEVLFPDWKTAGVGILAGCGLKLEVPGSTFKVRKSQSSPRGGAD